MTNVVTTILGLMVAGVLFALIVGGLATGLIRRHRPNMTGWRFYNWYLITGMSLFWIWALLGERPPEKELWQEFAHYDPAMVTGGVVRGTVRYESAQDCTQRARQKFHYEYVDIVGAIPMPANGIDAPYIFGCHRVNAAGQRLQDIKK